MDARFKKRLWIGGGVIMASIFIASGAFYFLSGSITSKADKIVAQKTSARNNANAIANFATLATALPEATKYETAIQKLLPDQSGLISFNTWIGQIAQKYGVIATVAYQGDPTPATASVPGSANFTMTAQGPEGSIVSFLDYLSSQAQGFILTFNTFDFTNDQSQEGIIAQGTIYFR